MVAAFNDGVCRQHKEGPEDRDGPACPACLPQTEACDQAELLQCCGIQDKYSLGNVIHEGSFGRVLAATLAENATQRRAVKLHRKEHARENMLFHQVQLLQELSHENVALFHDVFEDPDFLYIVMEICDGRDLFAELLEMKRFSESHTALLGGQMLLALRYIHSRHIVHRDVRAENWMIAGAFTHLKLVDFGFACQFVPGRMLSELCGSPNYIAPEMLFRKYNCLVDIWAFGVLQFLLMHGRYPFAGETPTDIMAEILSGPKWHTRACVSDTCMDFLQGVLAVQALRFSASDALEHVFMHMTDVDTLGDEESGRTRAQIECHVIPDTIQSRGTPYASPELAGSVMQVTPEAAPLEDFRREPEHLRRPGALPDAHAASTTLLADQPHHSRSLTASTSSSSSQAST